MHESKVACSKPRCDKLFAFCKYYRVKFWANISAKEWQKPKIIIPFSSTVYSYSCHLPIGQKIRNILRVKIQFDINKKDVLIILTCCSPLLITYWSFILVENGKPANDIWMPLPYRFWDRHELKMQVISKSTNFPFECSLAKLKKKGQK